jgi:energy-coupling factor transporter ATP-binding protein EcfA2
MIDGFKERKEEVLRLYTEYLPFKEKYDDNIDRDKLDNKKKNIENGKFILIVAGEAKSGKSTFINAFLGIEILPMDPRQCTSALIEINYGEEIALEAIYADGRKESISGEEAVRAFLAKHAALSDNYRKIPVTSINNEILVKSKGHVRESEIQDLIAGVKDDNLYSLPQTEYDSLIRDYINEWQNKWQDIVTRISITCPFSKDMREITIIDSPGVNAAGRVGDITNQYIEKADAVIFVKPLTGQAAESSSFRNFLSSNALGRSKGALILVLTRKADLGEENVFTLLEQAADMYRRSIAKGKITAVDSLLQLIFHKCQGKSGEEINNILNQKAYDCPPAKLCWFEADKVRSEYLNLLQKKSNFLKVGAILGEFATKAHYVQLCDFLTMIGEGYETIQEKLKERHGLLQKSAEDPVKLKKEIDKKLEEINEVKEKMYEGIERVIDEYTNHESGLIKLEAEKAFENFELGLSGAKEFDEIEKKTLDGQNAFFDFQGKLRDQLIAGCNKQLIEITDKTSLPVATIIPRLSKNDFESIKNELESDANETKFEEEGCWIFKTTKEYSVYSKEKHADSTKKKILDALENTKKLMVSSLHDLAHIISTKYKEKLQENMDKKNEEYTDLQQRMTQAEDMREEKKNIEAALSAIGPNAEKIQSIKGAIESVID